MRLGFAVTSAAVLVWFAPLAAAAAPALPAEEEPTNVAPETPSTQPADAPADAAPTDPVEPPQPDPPSGALGVDAGVEGSADIEPAPDASSDFSAEGDVEAAPTGDDKDAAVDDDDPGNVRGRREPLMPTNRGGIGLFHTTLPDAGGKYTVRFRIHTDFFRRDAFIWENATTGDTDTHARVRGGIALGFSPFEWGELFFSVNSAANRNSRNQPDRQDAQAIFALGDIDFGLKGAYRFKKQGIGLGGQLGVGLLSGSSRLLTSNVNFWFDVLFAVDIRYLTKKNFPFRFTTNIGWILDNSLRVAPYGDITDDTSREVTRFALSGNHNRLRMRYAVDFPIRLGKERQFGIDPILEWAWDVSTTEEPAFAQDNAEASPLPRTSQWLTIGVRANVVSGLHLDLASDIGLVSPSFQFGPPQPPWQIILGLGWSFDPNPVVKEVEVEAEAPPPTPQPVIEGRVVGSVVDPEGNPVPDAKITFPGLTSGAILTDASGAFTSYRFPAGNVAIQVMLGDQVVHETSAEVSDGQDTTLTIQLETGPAPATGIVNGNIKDDSGAPVSGSIHVTGQGVDEPFTIDAGQFALELYEGDYRATIRVEGFVDKTITFTVPASGNVDINETLQRAGPPDTPNVTGSKRSIRLKKKVRYKGNALDPASHAILDELAAFLSYHKEYEVVQVGVHTDDRGAAQKRSAERAEAVKSYLVSKGVAPDRLTSKGYGSSKPVAVNMTAAGRAKNNRTIFSVTKSSQ